MADPQQQSPEERLKAVRQIGLEALSAIDRARNVVRDGRGERTLNAIGRANAERVGDEAIDSTLWGELDTYTKLLSVAVRASFLAAEIETPLLPEGWTVRETISARFYFYQHGNAKVSITKEDNRDSMSIEVFGENTWAGYVGDGAGYVPLVEALTRAQETVADPSSHLSPAGVARVEAAKAMKKLDSDRTEVVAALRQRAQEWGETAGRYMNALVGERFIVIDRHERAVSQIQVEAKVKLELPPASLAGVSFMTKENAEKAREHLDKTLADCAPFAVWDFRQYAQQQTAKSAKLGNEVAEAKWTGGREAKNMREGKELAEIAMTRLGLPLPVSWHGFKGILSPWEYADLDVGGHKKLTVGASSGGVVSLDGDPFTPGDRKMNVTLANVAKSMGDAVGSLRRGFGGEVEQRTIDPLVLTRLNEKSEGVIMEQKQKEFGGRGELVAAKLDAYADFTTHKEAWRGALVIARDTSEDVDDKSYWEDELRAFDAAHAEFSGMSFVPDDFISHHRASWRKALEGAFEKAEVSLPDVDDKSYWRHEIKVFHRAYDVVDEVVASVSAMNTEQRAWLNQLEGETGLNRVQALLVSESLGQLAAMHLKLADIDLNVGLTEPQKAAQEAIENEIRDSVRGLPGIKDVAFIYDPRGTTVGVQFESGAYNSFNGSWKVPLADGAVKALGADFWEKYVPKPDLAPDEPMGSAGSEEAAELASKDSLDDVEFNLRDKYVRDKYVVLRITETGNAAFVDVGRDHEVARIINEAAETIASKASIDDVEFNLRDLNGNRVGKVECTETAPTGDPDDGTVRLSVETGNAAFEGDAVGEVARILREAADKVQSGEHIFAMRDYNGNLVGKFEFREEPSLEKDGVVDMTEALNTGRVYLADDGYSGIADGEYRFVVTAGDFVPGYGQGEGEVWLVNAKGETAPGYDDPQSVRETHFRELKTGEKNDLRAVVEGHVAFDDYERGFSDDDPELG